jgi:hypothetical protein
VIIGVPTEIKADQCPEIKADEYRVAITLAEVRELPASREDGRPRDRETTLSRMRTPWPSQ